MNTRIALYLFSSFFLLYLQRAEAQTDRKLVLGYYQTINKAELAIVDRDYRSAQELYRNAFNYKYPNGRDLYNAFVVAYGLKDSAEAKFYLEWLSYKYYHFRCDTSDAFNKYLSQNIDSFQDAGRTEKMKITVNFYQDIFMEDQRVRNEQPDDNLANHKVDSLNTKKIIAHIREYGFPSFKNVGFYSSMGSPFNNGMYWLEIWHQRPGKTDLDSMAEAAVLQGDFSPVDWATILSMREGKDKDPYHMLVSNDEKLTAQQIREIDKKRASIYLESLADYKKKLKRAKYIEGEVRKKGGYSFPALALFNTFLVSYLVLPEQANHN